MLLEKLLLTNTNLSFQEGESQCWCPVVDCFYIHVCNKYVEVTSGIA